MLVDKNDEITEMVDGNMLKRKVLDEMIVDDSLNDYIDHKKAKVDDNVTCGSKVNSVEVEVGDV